MPGAPGQERGSCVPRCHCQPEHPLLRCAERSHGLSQPSSHKRKKVLDCKRSSSYSWAKSSKKHIRLAAQRRRCPCDGFPAAWLILGHTPLSAVSSLTRYRLSSSLSLSKHPLPQKKETFYHKRYFDDKLTKGIFDFFFEQCLAIYVYFSLVTVLLQLFYQTLKTE